jgi:hypothetical protein
VILGNNAASLLAGSNRVTIDEIFRRTVARRPDATALVDPLNRPQFIGGAPRRLTYRDTDRLVSAIARHLLRMGLPADSIVGIQLPNTVESVLALLGVLRAGMIAAPMPLLWRRADAVAALGRADVKALITCAHVGAVDHADLAMHVAADIFSIRYVCAFGQDLPDGIVALDDLPNADMAGPLPVSGSERLAAPAAHVAVITWEVTSQGLIAVARSHMELIAGGIGVMLEGAIANDATILSTISSCSFAGLSLTLMPWLLSAGTLVLHHPFDPDVLAAQRKEHRCSAIVLPAPLAFRLANAGTLSSHGNLLTVVALWRSPERIAASPAWREPNVSFVDVPAFGEIGLFAARRGPDGRPAEISFGPMSSPRGAAAGVPVIELVSTDAGTLALRGPMVPRSPFPPESRGEQSLRAGPDGLVDTGYTCRRAPGSDALIVIGSPAGIAGVGGYRFPLHALQQCLRELEDSATLAALPDALLGHRLAASAHAPDAVRAALTERGVNPIVSAALRDRRSAPANAA